MGKLGNQCINAIHKGITVRVVGRIEVFEYTTENKLKTFSRTAIVANHIEYRSSKEYEDTNILDC